MGRLGQAASAAEEFATAVRLMPDLIEARLNWALALMREGATTEARSQFEEVLRRAPTNAVALRYAAALQQPGNP